MCIGIDYRQVNGEGQIMKNFLKQKLSQGEGAVGIWSIIPSAMVCEIVASAGLDFMIIDMEHGSFDFGTMAEAVRAIAANNCSPLVRIPFIEQTMIQRVLDAGAHGIVAPQVKTKKDAEHLVQCCRFPPDGIRGFNPFTRAGKFVADARSPMLDNDFPLVCVIIENLEAYSNLNDILAVDGVDVLYLGIYDMSCAYGIRGDMENQKIQDFVRDASRRITAAGRVVGKMVQKEEKCSDKDSSRFMVLKPDTCMLKNAIRDCLFRPAN